MMHCTAFDPSIYEVAHVVAHVAVHWDLHDVLVRSRKLQKIDA